MWIFENGENKKDVWILSMVLILLERLLSTIDSDREGKRLDLMFSVIDLIYKK